VPVPESKSDASDGRIHWLSGAIVTPLNMFVFPFLWYAFLLTAVVFITLKSGHLSDVRKFGVYGVWLGAVTLFVLWQSSRTKRVGIAGGELVVSSYFREERIPFKQVEAVEFCMVVLAAACPHSFQSTERIRGDSVLHSQVGPPGGLVL
jgi:hypothetical protein